MPASVALLILILSTFCKHQKIPFCPPQLLCTSKLSKLRYLFVETTESWWSGRLGQAQGPLIHWHMVNFSANLSSKVVKVSLDKTSNAKLAFYSFSLSPLYLWCPLHTANNNFNFLETMDWILSKRFQNYPVPRRMILPQWYYILACINFKQYKHQEAPKIHMKMEASKDKLTPCWCSGYHCFCGFNNQNCDTS